MRVELPYGDAERSLVLPGEVDVDWVAPRDEQGERDDAEELLGRALKDSEATPPLGERLQPKSRVLVVVSDPTRGGAREMLPAMVSTLTRMGVEASNVSVLVARGTHRSLTKEERQFFRSGVLARVRVVEHDCDDTSQLSALLFTRRGTPVRVNRRVRRADLVILLSPISFHYFAGFGGGRKLILPGCAWRPSILANHRLSLADESPVRLHRACRPGNLEGNPVHEDMCEAVGALDNVFGVNYFIDADGHVAWVNAGDPLGAHSEACVAYATRHRVGVSAPAAVMVVSAGGAPHDVNLLQSHKALYHACEMAREGASVLFYAACGEGIGSESLAAALAAPHDVFLARAREDYALNNQAAVSLLGLTRRYRVGMVTELEPEVLESACIKPVENPEAFIAGALDDHGAGSVTVIRSGARTLPSISGREES